jgi:hypothetical protein
VCGADTLSAAFEVGFEVAFDLGNLPSLVKPA